MQKRTRIFTAVTVLASFLLGLGIILSFQTQKEMSVSAASAGRHHHIQIQTVTVTNTNTVTAVPPGPMCFAFPNPAIIGSGSPGSGNPAGNVQFFYECDLLNATDVYTVDYTFLTCATGAVRFGEFVGTGAIGKVAGALSPDASGRLTGNFQLGGCAPSQDPKLDSFITLTNNRTQEAITVTVILA